jgi:hypothetical protein
MYLFPAQQRREEKEEEKYGVHMPYLEIMVYLISGIQK